MQALRSFAVDAIREESDRAAPLDPEAIAREKLTEPLRDLAEKTVSQGSDGNYSLGKIRVIDYRVDVMIYLSDLTDETIEALEELGFIQFAESKAIRLLIGTIDVRKLEALSKLDAVTRITPVVD